VKYKKIIASALAVVGISGTYATFGGISVSGDYQIVAGVKGYVTKPDPTSLPADYLVSGSQNVIINDQERVESRSGYELFGTASTTASAIHSAHSIGFEGRGISDRIVAVTNGANDEDLEKISKELGL